MFIDKFVLPNEDEEYKIAFKRRQDNGGYLDNGYPCMIFTKKELAELDFENITILYGTNGSGKSTLLNIIANKLQLDRVSPFNTSEMFDSYVEICKYYCSFDEYNKPIQIPKNSRIITSDDIFDYMLAVRTMNEEVAENTSEGRGDYAALKFGENIRLKGLEDYELFRKQVVSRKKNFIKKKIFARIRGQGSQAVQ